MDIKPKAVEDFEMEKAMSYEGASIFMEHPIERLKYHIIHSAGKILKSEFSVDGVAYVTWECNKRQYRAWSSWPDEEYRIYWKPLP